MNLSVVTAQMTGWQRLQVQVPVERGALLLSTSWCRPAVLAFEGFLGVFRQEWERRQGRDDVIEEKWRRAYIHSTLTSNSARESRCCRLHPECMPAELVEKCLWSRSGLAPEGSISTIRPRKDPGLHRQCHRIVLFSISFYTSTKLTIFVALAGTRFRRVTIYRHDIIAMIPTWEFQTFNEASPVEIAPFDRDRWEIHTDTVPCTVPILVPVRYCTGTGTVGQLCRWDELRCNGKDPDIQF